MKKKLLIIFLIICCTVSVEAQKTQTLTIRFENRFGKELLHPEQTYYLNGRDTLVINRFKYYISHIQLRNDDGKIVIPENQYYLIDVADENSTTIRLSIPDGTYTGIQFLLGVDSIRNVSGVQTGALDPLQGMFWTWNSGYIMAKLEGTASSSMIAGKQFTYHIGGFRSNQNTTRIIELKSPAFTNAISIVADASVWFKDIDIATTPICHSPGALAIRFANNYSTMFSISQQP